jgi:hypothetical protein
MISIKETIESDIDGIEIEKVELKWNVGKNPAAAAASASASEKKAKSKKRKNNSKTSDDEDNEDEHDHADHEHPEISFMGWLQGFDDSCMNHSSLLLVGVFFLTTVLAYSLAEFVSFLCAFFFIIGCIYVRFLS